MNKVIFCGGKDREMEAVKKVAQSKGCVIHDKNLSWNNAEASAYIDEIEKLDDGQVPIFVELEVDIDVPRNSIIVDHHNDRAGEPPAISQVCEIIGVVPTREQNLIGAMDAAYVDGLVAMGADNDEIRAFLGAQSCCKTVGDMLISTLPAERGDEIEEARRAVLSAKKYGSLIVVEIGHNWSAPVTAILRDNQQRQNILIMSRWKKQGEEKTEANYYSNGASVMAMSSFIEGWSGGAGLTPTTPKGMKFWGQYGGTAPDTAFWGTSGGSLEKIKETALAIATR